MEPTTAMTMPAADGFMPSTLNLDDRFVKNTGGNGENMISRMKYALLPSKTDRDP